MPVKLIQITWISRDLNHEFDWVHPADVSDFVKNLLKMGCSEIQSHD